MDAVEYRDIPGFPGYRVGSDGSVWSRRQMGKSSRPLADTWHRIATHFRSGSGYPAVELRAVPGGKRSYLFVHRLVLTAFVGPCPEGMVACHNDGTRTNNNLANLRWDTLVGNTADARRHGAMYSLLTEADVAEIHRLSSAGLTNRAIARRFGVCKAAVSHVLTGRNWKHLRPSEES